MWQIKKITRTILTLLPCIPLMASAAAPVQSMVIFGDSLSDNGNTTHLLKSLRQEEDPAYIVAPFKTFVVTKMIDFANDYYVPQSVLDSGITVVTHFFDKELAPYIADLIAKVRLVPLLPGKPYWNNRFSNGRVWDEYLATMLSIPMDDAEVYSNNAYAGSWAATYAHQLTVWNLIRHPLETIKSLIVGKLVPPSLGFTVQGYLIDHPRLDKNSLYFIASGANDYLNVLRFEDNYNPDVMSVYIDNVLDNLSAAVRKLVLAGAKHIVIMGVPHIGDTPRYVHTMDKNVLNDAADVHNERLKARIEELKIDFPQADFLFINLQDYLGNVLENPEKYNFSNVTDACIDVEFPMYNALKKSPFVNNYVLEQAVVMNYKDWQFVPGQKNYNICEGVDDYLFWDSVHPSTKAHKLLAYEVCQALQQHGYEVECKRNLA